VSVDCDPTIDETQFSSITFQSTPRLAQNQWQPNHPNIKPNFILIALQIVVVVYCHLVPDSNQEQLHVHVICFGQAYYNSRSINFFHMQVAQLDRIRFKLSSHPRRKSATIEMQLSEFTSSKSVNFEPCLKRQRSINKPRWIYNLFRGAHGIHTSDRWWAMVYLL